MFANAYQSGFISIFYSVGSNPLAIWEKQVKNGHIRRIVDEEVKSLVLEIAGTNVATTFITCPPNPKHSLAIKLPFLVMIIKNTKKYFTFEVQIKDDKDLHRRFRVSNFQSTTKVNPFCTNMPIGLSEGWNQVQFNLADFTKRAYGSTYIETTRVQIHANVRIRRIYFADMLYSEEDMPNEFKLYKPVPSGSKKGTETKVKQKGPVQEMPPPPSPVDTSPRQLEPTEGPEEVVEEITHPKETEEEEQQEQEDVVEMPEFSAQESVHEEEHEAPPASSEQEEATEPLEEGEAEAATEEEAPTADEAPPPPEEGEGEPAEPGDAEAAADETATPAPEETAEEPPAEETEAPAEEPPAE